MHVIHRLVELPTLCREVLKGGPARALGLFQAGKGRTRDSDGTHVRARRRTPGRDITILSAEAGTGPALETDDE